MSERQPWHSQLRYLVKEAIRAGVEGHRADLRVKQLARKAGCW